ncbi:MAG: alpha/beta hydrolase family esterase, partial [Gemmataceae bacterium]
DPTKPPKFLTNPQRWNDGAPGRQDNVDDVLFLNTILDELPLILGKPLRRLIVTGFSNGAGMTFRFAAEQSRRVHAIVPVGGYCWTPQAPTIPVPTWFLIGTADALVPPEGGRVLLPWGNKEITRPPIHPMLGEWARRLGNSPVSVSETSRNTPTEQHELYPGPTLFRVTTLSGLGHHWPGGRGQLNPRIGGPFTPVGDATAALLELFQGRTS